MALTRLKNIITSRTGRIIYVNPDDFDASDAYDNRGKLRAASFKTLQRAFLEVARFSYRVGLSNDEFDAFSIYLYPSEYVIDNRLSTADFNSIQPFNENTNFDLTSPLMSCINSTLLRVALFYLEVVVLLDQTFVALKLCRKYFTLSYS